MIEYGPLDQGEDSVLVPGLLDLENSPYWFNLTSVPQPGLKGRTSRVPCAAAVGGSTIINGIFWDRGDEADYDAWEELGNPGWGWEDLLPYFKKVIGDLPPFLGLLQVLIEIRVRHLLRRTPIMPKNSLSRGMLQCVGRMVRSRPVTPCSSSRASVSRIPLRLPTAIELT